jgi:hypothetical protein
LVGKWILIRNFQSIFHSGLSTCHSQKQCNHFIFKWVNVIFYSFTYIVMSSTKLKKLHVCGWSKITCQYHLIFSLTRDSQSINSKVVFGKDANRNLVFEMKLRSPALHLWVGLF